MHSTMVEYVTLFTRVIKYGIESVALSAALQTQQYMLIVRSDNDVVIAPISLMRHHRPHTHSYSNTLTSRLSHGFPSVEAIHLRGNRSLRTINIRYLLLLHRTVHHLPSVTIHV